MKQIRYKKILGHTVVSLSFCMSLLFSQSVLAEMQEKPILLVGASFESGLSPINNELQGPFGGLALGSGGYLGLGNALLRDERLNGFVINEARSGATTFTRQFCGPMQCLGVGWQGMDVQFNKALARVAIIDPFGNFGGYNADYVVIGMPNDCIHPGASGEPMMSSSPCSYDELNQTVDNLRDIALQAVSLGITPLINIMPKYEDLDFNLFMAVFGFPWIIDEMTYNELRQLIQTRIQAEVPGSIFVDTWAEFEHLGDGAHPTYDTATKAAKRLAQAMAAHSN